MSSSRRRNRPLVASALVLVAWGAFTFGGVYPWTYFPVGVVGLSIGAAAWFQARGTAKLSKIIWLAPLAVLGAGSLQLIPIGRNAVAFLSPAAVRFHEVQRDGQAIEPDGRLGSQAAAYWWTLSVDRFNTAKGLFLFTSYAALTLGLMRSLREDDWLRVVNGLLLIGVMLSLVAIVQRTSTSRLVYGFWTPFNPATSPMGPFINRNHFAGWMLMAVPLGWARLGSLSHSPGRATDLRSRLLAITDRDGAKRLLVVFATLTMMLAALLTGSRSGAIGLTLSLVGFALLTRRRSGLGAPVGLALVALAAVAFLWTGFSSLAPRLADPEALDLGGRRVAWAQAWRFFSEFWATGFGLSSYGVVAFRLEPALRLREAHNDYLQLLAEGGLLVSIPVLFLLGATALQSWRSWFDHELSPTMRWLKAGAFAGLVGIAVQEVFDFSLLMPGNAVLCCVLVALAVRRPTFRLEPSVP